jgi:hypothetical protein
LQKQLTIQSVKDDQRWILQRKSSF